MKKVLLHHIASDFGKPSSIGFRSQNIYDYSKKSIKTTIICRRNCYKGKTNEIWSIDLSFLFSRIFLFIRIYIFYRFPARTFELFIFNLLSIPYIFLHYISNYKSTKFMHTWDTSYWLLYFVKKLGYIVLKDCAMTPSKSSILESKNNPNFYIDNTTTIAQIKSERNIFKISDKIISPSKYTTTFIAEHYKIDQNKIITIPFGVDQKRFYFINKKSTQEKKIKLGFVGLVNKRKGIRWLIECLNYLESINQTGTNFELHLFGRIFNEEKKFINSAQFKIVKHGFIDNNKINIYEAIDLLVHPSFIEGSAKCIYEAMASGLPIICTKQSGSLVQHKINGFLVNAGETKELISAINFFLMNKSSLILMGKKSKSIIKDYTWERYSKSIFDLYK